MKLTFVRLPLLAPGIGKNALKSPEFAEKHTSLPHSSSNSKYGNTKRKCGQNQNAKYRFILFLTHILVQFWPSKCLKDRIEMRLRIQTVRAISNTVNAKQFFALHF